MNRSVPFMICDEALEPWDGDDWIYELKDDGIRSQSAIIESESLFTGRNGEIMDYRYPELDLETAFPNNTVFDSELTYLNKQGKSILSKALKRRTDNDLKIKTLSMTLPATLVAFDILFLEGKDLRQLVLEERKEILKEVIRKAGHPRVIARDYSVGKGIRFFKAIEAAGLEGMVGKKLGSIYDPIPGKVTPLWKKCKAWQRGWFQVYGYTKRDGEEAVSSLLLVDDEMQYVGRVGAGKLNEDLRVSLWDEFSVFPTVKSPTTVEPDPGREYRWIDPKMKVYVKYLEFSDDGKLRHPSIKEIRREG